jgi:hypothetical protein
MARASGGSGEASVSPPHEFSLCKVDCQLSLSETKRVAVTAEVFQWQGKKTDDDRKLCRCLIHAASPTTIYGNFLVETLPHIEHLGKSDKVAICDGLVWFELKLNGPAEALLLLRGFKDALATNRAIESRKQQIKLEVENQQLKAEVGNLSQVQQEVFRLKQELEEVSKKNKAAMHTLREGHKLALAAVTVEAFSMAVNKVKQTTLMKPTEETKQEEECEVVHNVKPQVTKEQAPSPPSSCGAAPTWTASMWMISSTAVAIRLCERLLVKVPTGTSEANKIRQLTKDQIQAVLEDPETVQELVRALMAGIKELNMQDEVDASKLNDKFVADGSGFAYVYGDMVDYHGGLEGASHKHLLLV